MMKQPALPVSVKNSIRYFFFLTVLFTTLPLCAEEQGEWGAEPTPAVVHPAVVSPFQRIISLRGEWDFTTDPNRTLSQAAENGTLTDSSWKDARSLHVPGCWEAQGVGEPGMSLTWDCTWDCNPRPLSHIYMGTALYRKRVEIPANWNGSAIWLKIGGVRSEARFWVNGNAVGVINNYCGTYKFEITRFVQPGKTAEILASVRNDTPSRKGQMCDFHRFGGLYRDVELEATPLTRIDDVWVQGTPGERDTPPTARVHLTLKTLKPSDTACIAVKIKTREGTELAEKSLNTEVSAEKETETVLDIPVEDAKLWTPESPNLYLAEVTLQAGGEYHGWTERFGFRRLEAKGTRFFLNGHPFFVRGYGETFIYPITLVSPADRNVHLENMRIIKSAGFNETRMHTHCEIPEYFEAADEAGILIQPELPYYQEKTTEAFPFDPMRDIAELQRHYRRYTSFAFYCAGNEGFLGTPLDKEIYKWIKKTDPGRPMQHQDGYKENSPENSDFGTMPYRPWPRGTYDDAPFPFIAHEYLNLTVKLDPRLEPLFTGALPSPVSMEKYESDLAQNGLSREWGDRCQRAAHFLQACQQKSGLESARLDPECDGYNFWNFIDQMVIQKGAYTSQGYMNAFYQVKDGGITPQEFAKFNSPTALLCDPAGNAVYECEDELAADFWISHFGNEPIPAGVIDWQFLDGETPTAAGAVPFERFEIGDVRIAAQLTFKVPSTSTPGRRILRAVIRGTEIVNEWVFYVFPKRDLPSLSGIAVDPDYFGWFDAHYKDAVPYGSPEAKESDAVIVRPGSECCKQAVAEGRLILSIRAPMNTDRNVSLGWWNFGPQLGTAFADHPAFGDFPKGELMDPALWRNIIKIDPCPLSEITGLREPLAVGNSVEGWSLYAGIQTEGDAEILALYGLTVMQDDRAALGLLDSFIEYLKKRKAER